MGLFDFFTKKKQAEEPKKNKILLAMPMFNDGETFEFNKVSNYLKSHWDINVTNVSGENDTVVFTIQDETVALATLAVQIPWSDIEGTAKYAYNWRTAEKDLKNHNSHVIVTLMSSNKSDVERFEILTKVLATILATSNCIGIYQGSQSLLIPKQQYLDSAEVLKSNQLPIELWVYIGLRNSENGNSAYTFGLNFFDKLEIEILNSKLDLLDLYDFLVNICAYVIKSNVTFKNGETLGYTAEQKIKITKSKGQFIEGETLKLDM